jgi:hypothetical protein
VLVSPAARAEVGGHVDADLDLGAPMEGRNFALGGGGRFGWRFDFGPVWLQPEAGGSYVGFLCLDCSDAAATIGAKHAARVLGGARIGGAGLISKVIEPALFGHAGYGWISSQDKGPAFDVGFALDVNAVRYFRFGAHGAYNVIASGREVSTGLGYSQTTPAVKWISFGLHLGVAF